MGKKGRNRRLIQERNRRIAQRYYYMTEVKRLRFDDAVRELAEKEFFLSEFTIWQILKKVSVPGAPDDYKPRKQHGPTFAEPILFSDESEP